MKNPLSPSAITQPDTCNRRWSWRERAHVESCMCWAPCIPCNILQEAMSHLYDLPFQVGRAVALQLRRGRLAVALQLFQRSDRMAARRHGGGGGSVGAGSLQGRNTWTAVSGQSEDLVTRIRYLLGSLHRSQNGF